jgi:hypothetical protein
MGIKSRTPFAAVTGGILESVDERFLEGRLKGADRCDVMSLRDDQWDRIKDLLAEKALWEARPRTIDSLSKPCSTDLERDVPGATYQSVLARGKRSTNGLAGARRRGLRTHVQALGGR